MCTQRWAEDKAAGRLLIVHQNKEEVAADQYFRRYKKNKKQTQHYNQL